MKRTVCFFILMFFVQLQFPSAQETKLRVAVFDPSSSGTNVDEGAQMAVRELISAAFVNTGKYIMVERSLLDKVMKELAFSNTGVVDDSQATEIGKLAGANKVVLSVVTLVGGRNMLSIKTIDVQTATIDLQKTKVVHSNDLLESVEPMTLEMLGEELAASSVAPAPKPTRNKLPFISIVKDISEKEKETKSSVETEIVVEFAGMASNKNPEAKIFVDKKFAGEGTFNGGFSVTFMEKKSGKHKVAIKWTGAKDVIESEDYTIDTRKQQKFTFECVRGKKYYELRLH